MVDLKGIKNRKCVNELHSMFAEQILRIEFMSYLTLPSISDR